MANAELLDRDPREVADELVAAGSADPDWLDAFAAELDGRLARGQLARVLAVWGLSQADAAAVFGVSRQAVSKWLRGGLPSARLEAVADLAAATDLLLRYLRRDRVPAVVRRPAPALDGRSLLDLASAGQTREVLAAARAMFDLHGIHA